jgi:hypothetical protein
VFLYSWLSRGVKSESAINKSGTTWESPKGVVVLQKQGEACEQSEERERMRPKKLQGNEWNLTGRISIV